MNHRSLCDDLAADLRSKGYRTYVEIKRVGQMSYGDRGRIDVLAMTPWTGKTRFDLSAYEVKLNRSDLLQDIKKGKWRRYVDEYGCSRVLFAFPESAGTADDVPTDAGVVIWRGDKWVRARSAKSLNTDQRKIDPLLLIEMISYEAVRDYSRNEQKHNRARSIKEILPHDAVEALYKRIDVISDKDLAQRVRFKLERDFGKYMGTEIAMRLARTKNDEIVTVEQWCESLIQIAAECAGMDRQKLRHDIVVKQDYSGIVTSFERLAYFERESKKIGALAGAIGTIANAYGYNSKHNEEQVSKAVEIAQEVNVA